MRPYYSKKTIEHFTHPKNFGEMKNADGIGKVGNPRCLLPNQNIHIDNKLKEISGISVKDRVLSHFGRYNDVARVVKRNYDGVVLNIKNRLGIISLTPDHLILATKIPKENSFLRTKNKKKLIPAWYHADDLEKGDIIMYPVPNEEKKINYIKNDIPKLNWDFRSRDVPDKIPINDDLLRLFGYFLSEGYVRNEPSKTYLSFALNITEIYIVEDIKDISKKLFGLDVTIKKIPKKKTVIVNLYNARIARLFKNLFGTGAANKSIPNFIMSIPIKMQKSLIYGLWKGDGYVNVDRSSPRAEYSTISFILVHQIKALLLRQKIALSIYEEKERKIDGIIAHKKAYRIHIGQQDSLRKLCAILNVKYNPKSYSSEKSWLDDNYFYTPITRIKKNNYKGKVYNLEVRESHSFTSEAFCLHNCGDLMKLYIKVEKKGRKEIIKDIKFHTLGCAAAIATSDIICDLVKGKEIKKALKIDYRDVVKELGHLPEIKIHCSFLAQQGLRAAIEDYEKRKKK